MIVGLLRAFHRLYIMSFAVELAAQQFEIDPDRSSAVISIRAQRRRRPELACDSEERPVDPH